MKITRKIFFVATVAACLLLAACGSDEKCVDSNVAPPASTPADAVPVRMSEALLDAPGVIIGTDNYHHCAEGLREIEIPTYRNHAEINRTSVDITTEDEYIPTTAEKSDSITTIRFNGQLPIVEGAYLTALDDYTDEKSNLQLKKRTYPSAWLPGMEQSLVFSSSDFGALEGLSSLSLCVR